MPVQLIGSPALPEVARVLTCLFEKDVGFQLIQKDSFRGTERGLPYLKLFQQPHGEALAFHDGASSDPLYESRKILRHIAEKYKDKGNPDLYGPGSLERDSIEQWLREEQLRRFDIPTTVKFTSVPCLSLNMPLDGTGAGGGDLGEAETRDPSSRQQEEEEEEQQFAELGKLLDTYEQRLAEQQYLAGSNFTLADLCHLPNADSVAAHPRTAHFIESRRNVKRWWDAISRRDSWSRVKDLQRPPTKDKEAEAAQL